MDARPSRKRLAGLVVDMAKTTTQLLIELPTSVASALAVFADAIQQRPADLAATIIRTWAGPLRGMVKGPPLPESKRINAVHRYTALQDWIAAGRPDGYGGVCKATLYNWEKRWRAQGLNGLIDQRFGLRARVNAQFMNEVRQRLARMRVGNVSAAYRAAVKELDRPGSDVPSLKSVRRHLAMVRPVVKRHSRTV